MITTIFLKIRVVSVCKMQILTVLSPEKTGPFCFVKPVSCCHHGFCWEFLKWALRPSQKPPTPAFWNAAMLRHEDQSQIRLNMLEHPRLLPDANTYIRHIWRHVLPSQPNGRHMSASTKANAILWFDSFAVAH